MLSRKKIDLKKVFQYYKNSMLKSKRFWLAAFLLIFLFFPFSVFANDSPYGMNTYLWWSNFFPRIDSNGDGQVTLRDDLDLLKLDKLFREMAEAGVKYNRITFFWRKIQPNNNTNWFWKEHDQVLKAQVENGIEPVPYFIYTPDWASRCADPSSEVKRRCPPQNWEDWEEFVRRSVKRYGSQGKNWVNYWEIWNEEDHPNFWLGSAEEYYQMLKKAYQVIKSEDPQAKVIIGGISDLEATLFVKNLFNNHPDIKNYFDIYAYHSYQNAIDEFNIQSAFLSSHSINKEIWINELNNKLWNNQNEGVIGIENLCNTLLNIGADKVFWFYFIDDIGRWGPGLFTDDTHDITDDYEKLPLYYAYQEMTGTTPPPGLCETCNWQTWEEEEIMGCGAIGCAGWPNEESLCQSHQMTRQKYCLSNTDNTTQCECSFRCINAPAQCPLSTPTSTPTPIPTVTPTPTPQPSVTEIINSYGQNSPAADQNSDNIVNGIDFGKIFL